MGYWKFPRFQARDPQDWNVTHVHAAVGRGKGESHTRFFRRFAKRSLLVGWLLLRPERRYLGASIRPPEKLEAYLVLRTLGTSKRRAEGSAGAWGRREGCATGRFRQADARFSRGLALAAGVHCPLQTTRTEKNLYGIVGPPALCMAREPLHPCRTVLCLPRALHTASVDEPCMRWLVQNEFGEQRDEVS